MTRIQNDSGAGLAAAWVGAAAVAAMLGSAVPAMAAGEELPISGEVSIEVHDDWTTRSDNPDDERNDAYVEIETALEAAITDAFRSEGHTSELQSLMRISYAVFCLKTKT